MKVIELTADSFEDEVLKSDVPVMVDFYSTYCGPCKMFSKIVDQVAEEMEGVKICKLNIDDAQDIALRRGITAVPTVMFFKNGEEKERCTGMQAKCRLNGTLTKLK